MKTTKSKDKYVKKITLTYEDGATKDIGKGAIIRTGRIEGQEEIEMGMEFCNMSGDDAVIMAQGIYQMLGVLGEEE